TMLLLGSATVPVVVAIASPQWASAAIAVVLAAAVASQIGTVAWAERRSAAPIERIELLRRVELFKVLTAPALETLARESRPITAKPGEIILHEGARGAEFYVIRSGRVAVTRGGHELATLGAGDGFGELALLFDAPRTATVVAIETVELLAIGRDAFLVAVTGEQAATHMVATYIDALDHPLGAWPGPPKLDSQP
ncbi:MAG: cyclic nucleotide-binding domain-containing protein, partial [Acidimicrobiia bacterium]